MERRWTDAQLSAIGANNKKILVSAAAGSGKTATLIERIIRSLTDSDSPLDLGRMLIVTFTKAAASELKLRILSALNKAISASPESRHLRRQLLLLESAQICTIDSFCLNVLKNEFQNSGNDASFKIGDENELEFIRVRAMDSSVEEVLKEVTEAGARDPLLEFFSVLTGPRRDNGLAQKLISVRSLLKNSPAGTEYIKDAALSLEADALVGDISDKAKSVILKETEYLFSHIQSVLEGYLETFEAQSEVLSKYGQSLIDDLEFARRVLRHVKDNSYFDVRQALTSFKFGKIGVLKAACKTPQSESYAAERTAYKKAVSNLISSYYTVNADDIKLINEKSSDFLSILYRVLSRFDENYTKAKRVARLLEFDDLKAGVYKLFVGIGGEPTPLALEYSSKYDIIYIDEYQDVDPIQNGIFNALAVNARLFMVGDIKQSIYGFRGSDPSIFGRLRQSFDSYAEMGEEAENATIYMSNNFRCSLPIIKASNFICSHLFRETDSSSESVGYTSSDDLVFSKVDSECQERACELAIIEPCAEEETKSSSLRAEIRYVASRICDIMANEKKEDGTPFSYSDFAILCDKNAQVKEVSDTLKAMGIPCDDAPSTNFFDSPEILLIHSLLSAIDNPFSDIHLASVLISPIFELSDDEVLSVRRSSEKETLYEAVCDFANKEGSTAKKCADAVGFLSEYGKYASSMPVSEFMTLLWNKADIGAVASFSAPDGRSVRMRRENIEKLYNYALAYSSVSFKTLHAFLSFLKDAIEVNPKSSVFPVASSESSENVHVMTIHKSKGLEFPVCFLMGTGAQLFGRLQDSEVVFDKDAGLYFDPCAKRGLVRIRSPYKAAVISRIKEKQTLEKIRLLYVAMTRAREQLIITATRTPSVAKSLIKYAPAFSLYAPHVNSRGVYPILNASTFAEWILLCDPFRNADSCITLKEIYEGDIPEVNITSEAVSSDKGGIHLSNEEKDEIRKRFDFSYFSASSLLPAKVAVSQLSPTALDEDNYLSAEIADSPSFEDRPWFMLGSKGASAAERGTATHLFLQFADFDLCVRDGIESEIKRLAGEGFILSEHAEIINRDMLSRFFGSEFFGRIASARRVLREQRFNMPFPAHLFTEDEERRALFSNEYVLVQGVIDLIMEDEDGRLTLADYKTDYVTPAEMKDDALLRAKFVGRYYEQLSYYALAVERLFGKSPDSVIIYSLSAGKEITVDVKTLI